MVRYHQNCTLGKEVYFVYSNFVGIEKKIYIYSIIELDEGINERYNRRLERLQSVQKKNTRKVL